MDRHRDGRPAEPRPDPARGNNALVSNLERPALFHAIAQAIRRTMPFERTAIFLLDPEREVLALSILESSLPSTYFAVGLEVPLDNSSGRGDRCLDPRAPRPGLQLAGHVRELEQCVRTVANCEGEGRWKSTLG